MVVVVHFGDYACRDECLDDLSYDASIVVVVVVVVVD